MHCTNTKLLIGPVLSFVLQARSTLVVRTNSIHDVVYLGIDQKVAA